MVAWVFQAWGGGAGWKFSPYLLDHQESIWKPLLFNFLEGHDELGNVKNYENSSFICSCRNIRRPKLKVLPDSAPRTIRVKVKQCVTIPMYCNGSLFTTELIRLAKWKANWFRRINPFLRMKYNHTNGYIRVIKPTSLFRFRHISNRFGYASHQKHHIFYRNRNFL